MEHSFSDRRCFCILLCKLSPYADINNETLGMKPMAWESTVVIPLMTYISSICIYIQFTFYANKINLQCKLGLPNHKIANCAKCDNLILNLVYTYNIAKESSSNHHLGIDVYYMICTLLIYHLTGFFFPHLPNRNCLLCKLIISDGIKVGSFIGLSQIGTCFFCSLCNLISYYSVLKVCKAINVFHQ